MGYMDSFRDYYTERFSGSSASTLVEQEDLLSKFIDNDDFISLWLMDEAIAMYEIVRDECVKRVAILASSDE